jgi:hypothetical protein
MKDKSIRKLRIQDTNVLEDIMGFSKGALKKYAGRHVKIILKSPREIKGVSGTVYRND